MSSSTPEGRGGTSRFFGRLFSTLIASLLAATLLGLGTKLPAALEFIGLVTDERVSEIRRQLTTEQLAAIAEVKEGFEKRLEEIQQEAAAERRLIREGLATDRLVRFAEVRSADSASLVIHLEDPAVVLIHGRLEVRDDGSKFANSNVRISVNGNVCDDQWSHKEKRQELGRVAALCIAELGQGRHTVTADSDTYRKRGNERIDGSVSLSYVSLKTSHGSESANREA